MLPLLSETMCMNHFEKAKPCLLLLRMASNSSICSTKKIVGSEWCKSLTIDPPYQYNQSIK